MHQSDSFSKAFVVNFDFFLWQDIESPNMIFAILGTLWLHHMSDYMRKGFVRVHIVLSQTCNFFGHCRTFYECVSDTLRERLIRHKYYPWTKCFEQISSSNIPLGLSTSNTSFSAISLSDISNLSSSNTSYFWPFSLENFGLSHLHLKHCYPFL